ncbi:MAG: metalloregulator ArsR/SmtB family transcription factor [Cetobacterium sp.]|uniref:ArsR/SmtB family transcription factor n=1 Tax=Cetobacterium TaxID=180162 RepID=UPI002E7B73D9|nr:metalloregulator ArsR/SmtB family transcription factor [Cetobacterium somerae]WVJ03441.1 metalloregulator ArsR/SmtB family transcription factor [Cetobacterium somerae]
MEILEILKSLADLNRLRILKILLVFKEACNCDLEEVLKLNQSNTSRHITKLRKDKLIICQKKGKWSYYSLNLELLEKNSFIIDILESLENSIFLEDKNSFIEFLKTKNYCLD